MPQRSIFQIVDHIEFTYGMWDRFEISTGAAIDLLKSLVSECRSVTQQSSFIETADDAALMARVYDLVCKLRDTWRAHVVEEEEDLADEQWVS
jgi:hypothetical protein